MRIYPDDQHPFKADPHLSGFEVPRRRLRVREPLFALPEGFEPLNDAAYRRRFGHMLSDEDDSNLASKLKTSTPKIPSLGD